MINLSKLKERTGRTNAVDGKFITKLEFCSDLQHMQESLTSVLGQTSWGDKNQIGLKYRPGAEDVWHDAAGSLYDRERKIMLGRESDFTQWNTVSEYLRTQISTLSEQYNFVSGRVRFMRLLPKTGLSVHADAEFRYHFVLKTNPYSYISGPYNMTHTNSDLPSKFATYHLPCDGCWYKVDTRQQHWVYNGGQEERIHLVVCG